MRIAVAMSGGVDSSVVAAMLKSQGHDLVGITMRLFDSSNTGPGTAAHDAAAVASHLGIPHHLAGFEQDFRHLVIDNFIDEYGCGHTPNPCVQCNRHVKFGLLLEKAKELGAEMLATGHYARKTVDPDGLCHLRMAANRPKDQSYFLYTLNQERLSKVLFPLGDISSKDEVRRMAAEFGLPVAEKGDSQEVCFIPNDDYVAFLELHRPELAREGEIVHLDGQVLGRHRGTYRHTIGQRKGLGIAWSEPLYVIGIDKEKNRIIVGEQSNLFACGLLASELSWVIGPDSKVFECQCKIRYRHQPVPCSVELGDDMQSLKVRFMEPQKSVTPGQSLVLYDGDQVLGGGIIQSAAGG